MLKIENLNNKPDQLFSAAKINVSTARQKVLDYTESYRSLVDGHCHLHRL